MRKINKWKKRGRGLYRGVGRIKSRRKQTVMTASKGCMFEDGALETPANTKSGCFGTRSCPLIRPVAELKR